MASAGRIHVLLASGLPAAPLDVGVRVWRVGSGRVLHTKRNCSKIGRRHAKAVDSVENLLALYPDICDVCGKRLPGWPVTAYLEAAGTIADTAPPGRLVEVRRALDGPRAFEMVLALVSDVAAARRLVARHPELAEWANGRLAPAEEFVAGEAAGVAALVTPEAVCATAVRHVATASGNGPSAGGVFSRKVATLPAALAGAASWHDQSEQTTDRFFGPQRIAALNAFAAWDDALRRGADQLAARAAAVDAAMATPRMDYPYDLSQVPPDAPVAAGAATVRDVLSAAWMGAARAAIENLVVEWETMVADADVERLREPMVRVVPLRYEGLPPAPLAQLLTFPHAPAPTRLLGVGRQGDRGVMWVAAPRAVWAWLADLGAERTGLGRGAGVGVAVADPARVDTAVLEVATTLAEGDPKASGVELLTQALSICA